MQSRESEEFSDMRMDDDLTIINGIGPSWAEALHKIGIWSFADLARYSPQSLSLELLNGANVKISSNKIEQQNWIGQANALTHSLNLEPLESDESEVHQDNESPSSSWRQKAGFSLFFDYSEEEPEKETWRTRVYHDETGEETEFLTVDTPTWVNWIIEKGNLPLHQQSMTVDEISEKVSIPVETPPAELLQAPAPDELSKPKSETDDILHFEIQDVTVSVSKPSMGLPEKGIMVNVDFHLEGAEAIGMVAERVPYRVEIYTVNLQSNVLSLVASERGLLQPDVSKYRSLQTFSIPELGRYELYSLVILLPPVGKMSYFSGPIFKIVP
jgi:hypothetical protein